MKKVQFETLKPWIATKLTDLLGTEDEILINLAIGLFEDPPLSVSSIRAGHPRARRGPPPVLVLRDAMLALVSPAAAP